MAGRCPSPSLAQQAPAADTLQRPLRSRFRARLRRSVAMTSGVKSCDSSFLHILTPFFCVIGRAGASKTRRLITLISVDWVPPYLYPSGTGLGLGTRVSCSRLTPTRVVPYRGGGSADKRFQPVFPLRERTSAMRCLGREGNFPGNGPHTGNQFSRKSHHDLIGVLAASHELSIPCA